MGIERLTQEEVLLWTKLTEQKKPLKEQQQIKYQELKQKMCLCECHTVSCFDYHWFESCC